MRRKLSPWYPDYLAVWIKSRRAKAVNGGKKSSQISTKISSFVFTRGMKVFGTTWGWVINDRIFIFGWTKQDFHFWVNQSFKVYFLCFSFIDYLLNKYQLKCKKTEIFFFQNLANYTFMNTILRGKSAALTFKFIHLMNKLWEPS